MGDVSFLCSSSEPAVWRQRARKPEALLLAPPFRAASFASGWDVNKRKRNGDAPAPGAALCPTRRAPAAAPAAPDGDAWLRGPDRAASVRLCAEGEGAADKTETSGRHCVSSRLRRGSGEASGSSAARRAAELWTTGPQAPRLSTEV